MGVLNLTPDSFSGDGIYKDVARAVAEAERIVEEGADIIDIGGESTRPGAALVETSEEIKRVISVLEKVAKRVNVPISIDTRKAEVARRAIEAGASIINDITGLEGDGNMLDIASRYSVKVVIMHIKGEPQTMQRSPAYDDVISQIMEKLRQLIGNAEEAGVKKENIIIDPGIGFGKTLEHNLEILNKLSQFKTLNRPILIGPSRKSFIGNILGAEPEERIFGTAAAVSIAIKNGADIVRVHDVKEIKQVAMVSDAIVRSREAVNV